MATFNLVRNSRVFFTTNLATVTSFDNSVNATGIETTNTKEIQVMDGFTFSQATNADTIQINEAGSTPVRGQRSFNTSLNNVEFSFSTYIRPRLSAGNIVAEEDVLWNALLSDTALGGAAGTSYETIGGTVSTATYTPATGTITITGTAMTTGAVVGKKYVMSGFGGVGASYANVPVSVTSNNGTTMVLTVLSAGTATGALTASTAIKFNKTAWVANASAAGDLQVGSVPYSLVSSALSNKNQLQPFGMIFNVDGVTYLIDNCAMDQASIEFGLDGIAMVAWTGKGTRIRETALAVTYTGTTDATMAGGLTGTAAAKSTTAKYITNKLSTVSLISNIGGLAGTPYTLALTGGNITIANNITYVIPANLGVVNQSIGYFTGTRAVSGNITAYLRTGTTNTAGLLTSMLTNASTSVDPKFQMSIQIGGSGNTTRVDATVYGAMLQIPTIDAQAVMSTTINFNAQGTAQGLTLSANTGYDIEETNDIAVRYFASA